MTKIWIFMAISLMLFVACSQTQISVPSTATPTIGNSENVSSQAQHSGSKTVQVSISNFAFSPAQVNVNVGDTVVWTNLDSVTHTVTSSDGTFNSGAVAPGSKFSFTFNTKGTYGYMCSIHPSMKGSVTVQ